MSIIEKKCSKCSDIKPLSEYYRHKNGRDGYSSWCKSCHKRQTDAIRKSNPDKVRECCRKWISKNMEKKRLSNKNWKVKNAENYAEKMKLWREGNKDLLRKKQAAWKEANPGLVREAAKRYRKRHADEIKTKKRGYRTKNKEKCSAISERWRINNRAKYLVSAKKSQAKRRSTPAGTLNNRMSTGIYRSLKRGKGGAAWMSLVNYNINDLHSHLEKKFKGGMTWGNMGEWHIDHIVPRSAFNFEGPEDVDFKRCWNLNNLRPMWARDNIIKGAKLIRPFQPSLTIKIPPTEGG